MSSPYRRSLALLTAALLAGCAAIPKVAPQVEQVSASSLGLGAADVAQIAPDWWTALGDPQLDRIMADALAGNPTLEAAMARLRIAQAGIAAQRAGLLPQIGADISEQRQRLSEKALIPPPYAGSGQWIGTAQASLSWSLDLAGKQKAIVDQARASADAALFDLAAARVTLSGAVAETYANLTRADTEARIATEFIQSREASLKLAETRKASALASDFDIRAAQTLLAQARQRQVRAEGNRALMIHALAALAGRGADYHATIGAPMLRLDGVLPVPTVLPADLIARRADIMAARARVDASEAGRRAARAAFYPNVDIRAFLGASALGLGSLFTGGALAAGVGPAIHLPIFEGGRLKADYKAAVGQIDVAVADYNGLVIDAVKQAADALSAVDTSAADAHEQRAILADLQETVRLDGVRVRSGLGSRLDVLATGDRLLAARQDQANIDADGMIHRIQLLTALGGGFAPLPIQSSAPAALTQRSMR
ncbi:efflux transporter outer membrane subunit [Sphingobium sp. EM0848]|uniref:efflux transporter outer membrane subunit n=1 Tax=Sphingobium sp. EM0848 TaxID=2743473 RepID=UPI00159C75C3|nr:efflux transporter outer membrane subunit [Sphingobium sp. EM0848]